MTNFSQNPRFDFPSQFLLPKSDSYINVYVLILRSLLPVSEDHTHFSAQIFPLSRIFLSFVFHNIVAKMSAPTIWFCGHCSYGPMRIAIFVHCCMCHHQQDETATFETQETRASDSYYASPLPLTADWIDSTLEPPSHIVEEPKLSYSTASIQKREAILGDRLDRERTCAIGPTLSAYRTMRGPAGPPIKWYCCICMWS